MVEGRFLRRISQLSLTCALAAALTAGRPGIVFAQASFTLGSPAEHSSGA